MSSPLPVNHDVIIVGGGPAGATAAWCLARGGLRVLVLDRSTFPRPKLCAGLLTWKTIDLLRTVFGLDLTRLRQQGLIDYACRDYAIYNRTNRIVRGRLAFAFHRVDRRTYDHFWLQRAARAGARLALGVGVARIEPEGPRVVTTCGQELRARFIIGADGVHSLVRRSLIAAGYLPDTWQQGLATALEVEVPRDGHPGLATMPTLYFGFIPWGYAWSFPGSDRHVLGICGLNHRAAPCFRRYLGAFLRALNLPECVLHKAQGFPLPYGNYLSRVNHGALLLAGDAAGLADPLLGEGIYYAHASGRLAAQAILQAGTAPECAAGLYQGWLNRSLLRELRWAKVYRTLVFTVLRIGDYRALAMAIRLAQARIEAIIQGRRRFSRGILF